jgi:hypothetical protein
MKYSGLRERFVNFPAPATQSRSARLFSQSTCQSTIHYKQQIACENSRLRARERPAATARSLVPDGRDGGAARMRLTQVVARRNGKAVAIGDMLCGRELQTERCQRPQRGRCRGRFNRTRADESVPKQFHHV